MKNSIGNSGGTLSVSSEIKKRLPEVLIEYLWKLALNDRYLGYVCQCFNLKPAELGGRDILDIDHICNLDQLAETRRVFGMEPVGCRVQVLNSPDGYEMLLCQS